MKNINLLSQNGGILVNYRNVLRLFIRKVDNHIPWEIRVEYPKGGGFDTMARFNSLKECETVFKKVANLIANETSLISFDDL